MDIEPIDLKKLQARPVTREEVAQYYLEGELTNILDRSDSKLLPRNLSGKSLWRLLEALSFTYRANGVFHTVTDSSYDWYKASIPIDHIRMTSISPAINKILAKPEINQSPARFSAYLQRYFAAHIQDDPEQLNEFRPGNITKAHKTVILREQKGKGLGMLDGSHRMIALVAAGKTKVDAFIAVCNGKNSKPMLGDTTFLLLRKAFQATEKAEDREAILHVVKLLMAHSSDGRQAVQTYWVDHGYQAAAKAADPLLHNKV